MCLEILRNSPRGSFQTARFGTQTKKGETQILSAHVSEEYNHTILRWQYSGLESLVLYFVVMAMYNGKKAPVGFVLPQDSKEVTLDAMGTPRTVDTHVSTNSFCDTE